MKNMRVSITATEILSIFQFYHRERKALTIWQNIKGTRIKVSAIVFEFSAKNEVRFLSLGKEMPFQPDSPLYIYGEHKTLVFKTTARSIIAGELWVPLPKIVRFEEMRKIKRFDLVDLKSCEVGFTKQMDVENSKNFSCKINDLSEAGISFLISKDSPLLVGDDLRITQVQNDQIHYNLSGKIVHISPRVNSAGLIDIKLTKVGVQFKQKLRIKDLYIYKKVIKDLL